MFSKARSGVRVTAVIVIGIGLAVLHGVRHCGWAVNRFVSGAF